VNNAGTQEIVDCVAPDAGEAAGRIAREIQLNFITPVTLGLHLMPVLLRHREAAICNITSGLALAPKQSAPVYCAEQIVEGMRRNRPVIDVGKTRLLRATLRLSPALGYRILREG
jgi:NADP-dependent 3-hydroxy acid dehydrogenase YdfG